MTEQEFWDIYNAKAKAAGFQVGYEGWEGKIRIPPVRAAEGVRYFPAVCPVCFVANEVQGERLYDVSASTANHVVLKLDPTFLREVMEAADYADGRYKDTRAKLLQPLELVSSAQ